MKGDCGLVLGGQSAQGGPGFSAIGAGDRHCAVVVSVEAQLVKEALVHETTDVVTSELVSLVDAVKDAQGDVECVFNVGVGGMGSREHGLSLTEVAGDAVVFVAREVTGDKALDHAPGQPAALGFQFPNPSGGPGQFGFGPAVLRIEFGFESDADLLLLYVGDPFAAVVGHDGLLHRLHR